MPVVVSARANGHRIALDLPAVGEASRVHAIIGREIPAYHEGNQCSCLSGRILRIFDVSGAILAVVHPHDAFISFALWGDGVARVWPVATLAETYVQLLLALGICFWPRERRMAQAMQSAGRDCLKVRLEDASNILLR